MKVCKIRRLQVSIIWPRWNMRIVVLSLPSLLIEENKKTGAVRKTEVYSLYQATSQRA